MTQRNIASIFMDFSCFGLTSRGCWANCHKVRKAMTSYKLPLVKDKKFVCFWDDEDYEVTGEVDEFGKLCGFGFFYEYDGDGPVSKYECTFLNNQLHGIGKSLSRAIRPYSL